MKRFVLISCANFGFWQLIVVLMVCMFGSVAWADLCKTCSESKKAVSMGDACSVTVQEEGPNGPIVTVYEGTISSDVSYKVCKRGFGVCNNSLMTLEGKCGYNPQPNLAVIVPFNIKVSGCGQ